MIKYDFTSYNKIVQNDSANKINSLKERLSKDSMTDWFDIEKCISNEELNLLIKTSQYIRNNYNVLVVIGIGGSYLGSKAIIDALLPYFHQNKVEIIFAGNSLSPSYHQELINYLKNKNYIINVVSKSGTTLETNIIFDLLIKELKKKYNENEIQRRIIVTTDSKEGNLRDLVNKNDYLSFAIPKNIGGRFSVLTAAGLLPIAVSGIDVRELLKGAKKCNCNNAYSYAIIRDELYKSGKVIESFTVYEPKLLYFTEWLKQLFAESQGKNNKGIMPISSINTRDLHSLGQYFQQGSRILFETVIGINESSSLNIEKYNKDLNKINNIALYSVAKAHFQDETFSNIIEIDKLNAYNIGELIYFFELAAASGAYLLDVNPFDQPGVNKYKELIKEQLEVNDD